MIVEFSAAVRQLKADIRQEELREPLMALLHQGLTRRTIEQCVKTYCKEEARHALRP